MKSVQLHLGDCIDVMRLFPSASVDLVVTSPPYDNLRDYDGLPYAKFQDVAIQLRRVVKKGGVVVWVVGDATIDGTETGTSFAQALFFKTIGFKLHDTMIYRKKNPMPIHNNRYNPSFEYMFVLSRSDAPKTFNPLFRPSKRGGEISRMSTRKASGVIQDATGKGRPVHSKTLLDNVWDIAVGFGVSTKDSFAFEHPAMFPEALARDHILSWSNERDTVLDPFMGSGTVGKMAKATNRRFIGVEKDPKFFEISKKRVGHKV